MRRILPLLFSAILLGACAPNVVLLTRVPDTTPTATPAAAALPASATPAPSPTRAPDLGIRPDALKGVQLTAWTGWDGSTAGLFGQLAEEFNLTNRWGIQVKLVPQSNLNLLASAVDQSLRGPEHPDIVVALPEQLLSWRENLTDLAPYLAQPEFGLDAVDSQGAFWDQSNLAGARYGVPAARSARFIFYNTSFARDLGFTSAPLSVEDFRAQACAANAFWKKDTDLTNDGYGGLALDVTPNWQTPYSWLAAGGGQAFTAGAFQFDSPANISALELVTSLRADDCAWSSSSEVNDEHFVARRALFITGSLADIAPLKQAFATAKSADTWTLLPFPGNPPVIVGYGPDYAVLKSGEARQLASWLFIRWMLEPQNQVRVSRATGLLPVTAAAANLLKEDAAADPQWAAAVALIPRATTYPQTPQWRLANKVLADGFMAYFGSYPNASLEGVLKAMDATIADITP